MKSIIANAALLAATVSAKHFYGALPTDPDQLEKMAGNGNAKVTNRCSYPVYLWSIDKQLGCQAGEAVKLESGDDYTEKMKVGSDGGISVKLSKSPTCTVGALTQLEYNINPSGEFEGNFLDMSFVDCHGDLDACPGRTDGFYMQSGNQTGAFKSTVDNEHCPVFSVNNAEEAAKVSYVLWDDRQTKFCGKQADVSLFICGGEAPDAEDPSPAPETSAAPSSSTSSSSSSSEAASSTSEEADFKVAAAAAVTPAPAAPVPVAPVVKTEVVYVTEYIKARHAHGRRHQQFHA